VAKLVYAFSEGNKDLKDLLGGKGANLAEMTNIGLPVPSGFTITTEACRYYLEHGGVPEGLAAEVEFAADLTDADRIRILRDLLRTADAIRKSKSAEELRRDEDVRRSLEEPGRQRYIAFCERLG